jgi:hypothetical protein
MLREGTTAITVAHGAWMDGAVFTDGLGLLPYSTGVHDSLDDQPRRRVSRGYVANGELPAGYSTKNGVGLHYVGTELDEAVAMLDGAQAWVEPLQVQ